MVKKGGNSREAPSVEPGHEEACDERSKPQDVTSTWTGREGIILPQEVEPHAVGKISSQLPTEGYRRKEIDGRNEHTSGSAGRGVGLKGAVGQHRHCRR